MNSTVTFVTLKPYSIHVLGYVYALLYKYTNIPSISISSNNNNRRRSQRRRKKITQKLRFWWELKFTSISTLRECCCYSFKNEIHRIKFSGMHIQKGEMNGKKIYKGLAKWVKMENEWINTKQTKKKHLNSILNWSNEKLDFLPENTLYKCILYSVSNKIYQNVSNQRKSKEANENNLNEEKKKQTNTGNTSICVYLYQIPIWFK